MLVGEAINKLTTWTSYAISKQVIVKYTNLLIIVRYKIGSDKCKSQWKYLQSYY
jgi:hypothetical protein